MSDHNKMAAKVAAKYIAPIDLHELACRMLEAGQGVKRPPGLTAQQALAIDPEAGAMALQMAEAAMRYWQECIRAVQVTN